MSVISQAATTEVKVVEATADDRQLGETASSPMELMHDLKRKFLRLVLPSHFER